MGMKPWERAIIEYRPNIAYRRTIRTRIIKDVETSELGLSYKPTIVVDRLLQKTGSDIINKLIATLSKAHKRLEDLKKELADEPVYMDYEEARKENDTAKMQDIYLDHLKDIDGHPSFNVYPLVDEYVDEIEQYLDFVNDELFGGTVDYSDTSTTQREEEKQLEQILQIEAEDLAMPEEYPFTKEQIALIEQAIKDPDSDFNSVKDYAEAIKEEKLNQGSPSINYSGLSNRVQTIEALDKKAEMFDKTIDAIGGHVDTRLPDFLNNDIDGAFDYIVNTPNPKPNMHDLFIKRPDDTTGLNNTTSGSDGGSNNNNSQNNSQNSNNNNNNNSNNNSSNNNSNNSNNNNNSSNNSNNSNNNNSISGQINAGSNVGAAGESTIGTILDEDNINKGTGNIIYKGTTPSIESLKHAAEIGHRYYANKTINCVKNMKRVGDRELREFMDLQLSIISKQKEELVDGLRKNLGPPSSDGSIAILEGVTEAVRAVNNAWKFILVEHIGTTELNEDQSQRTFGMMDSKKSQQMLNQYTKLFSKDVENGNALNESSELSGRDLSSSKFW